MGSKPSAFRALLLIHSSPAALRQHLNWAVQSAIGDEINLQWKAQPLLAGTFRTSLAWRSQYSKAGELASALRSWHYLNFEIQESDDTSGELFRFTPELGIHRAVTDLSGAVMVSENQINSALKISFDEESIRESLAKLFGTPWDLELEQFRGIDTQERSHLQAI